MKRNVKSDSCEEGNSETEVLIRERKRSFNLGDPIHQHQAQAAINKLPSINHPCSRLLSFSTHPFSHSHSHSIRLVIVRSPSKNSNNIHFSNKATQSNVSPTHLLQPQHASAPSLIVLVLVLFLFLLGIGIEWFINLLQDCTNELSSM